MGTWDWKSSEIHICRQGNACPCLLDMFLIHLLEFFCLTFVPLGYSCGEVERWPCGFFGASVARAVGTCSVYGWAVAAGSSCHCSVTAASEKEMTFSGTELWPLSFHKDFFETSLGVRGEGMEDLRSPMTEFCLFWLCERGWVVSTLFCRYTHNVDIGLIV